MAVPTVLVDTTFANKNITTAVSVYEYTAAATVTVRIQVRLASVAGNGDYIAHLTLNDGDAQTDDAIGPRTTYPAASGETAFWFATMFIDLIAGDVINIFIKGQAGDTDESGSVRIFTDGYLQPATAGRTLNVSASGEADADMVKISTDATAADNLESVLDGTGGAALKMGQVVIAANVNAQGALDIRNAHATGYGVYAGGGTAGQLNQASAGGGLENIGTIYGEYNLATAGSGQVNSGTTNGQNNSASAGTGQYNIGTTEGQWNTASAGPGQINGGTTYGQVNSASAGPGQYDSGSTFGIQAVGVTDPLSANMITAASIATDAIDADALALSAITEMQAGLATSASIGTPVALDGGAATLAGMLTKMADDNNGATFDATDDSLNKIRDQVDTLAPGAAIVLNADITEIHT